jgi:hypothetical protein
MKYLSGVDKRECRRCSYYQIESETDIVITGYQTTAGNWHVAVLLVSSYIRGHEH